MFHLYFRAFCQSLNASFFVSNERDIQRRREMPGTTINTKAKADLGINNKLLRPNSISTLLEKALKTKGAEPKDTFVGTKQAVGGLGKVFPEQKPNGSQAIKLSDEEFKSFNKILSDAKSQNALADLIFSRAAKITKTDAVNIFYDAANMRTIYVGKDKAGNTKAYTTNVHLPSGLFSKEINLKESSKPQATIELVLDKGQKDDLENFKNFAKMTKTEKAIVVMNKLLQHSKKQGELYSIFGASLVQDKDPSLWQATRNNDGSINLFKIDESSFKAIAKDGKIKLTVHRLLSNPDNAFSKIRLTDQSKNVIEFGTSNNKVLKAVAQDIALQTGLEVFDAGSQYEDFFYDIHKNTFPAIRTNSKGEQSIEILQNFRDIRAGSAKAAPDAISFQRTLVRLPKSSEQANKLKVSLTSKFDAKDNLGLGTTELKKVAQGLETLITPKSYKFVTDYLNKKARDIEKTDSAEAALKVISTIGTDQKLMVDIKDKNDLKKAQEAYNIFATKLNETKASLQKTVYARSLEKMKFVHNVSDVYDTRNCFVVFCEGETAGNSANDNFMVLTVPYVQSNNQELEFYQVQLPTKPH